MPFVMNLLSSSANQWRQSLEKPGGDSKITRAAENLKMRGAKNLQWGALYNIKF